MQVIAIVVVVGSTSDADNPIIQTLYTADPALRVHDGVCYIYTSHDEDVIVRNFFTINDWRCYSATDMVNGTEFNEDGTIPTMNMTQEGPPRIGRLDSYKTVQAETSCLASGVETEKCSEGGMNVCVIENGDYIKVKGVDFGSGAASFEARVAAEISRFASIVQPVHWREPVPLPVPAVGRPGLQNPASSAVQSGCMTCIWYSPAVMGNCLILTGGNLSK